MSVVKPVIVCCAARNELHNLQTVLPAWKVFADRIVICDQMSEDGSREWLKTVHPDVIVVDNPGDDYDERSRAAILLSSARAISTNAVLLFLDADESLSANVIDSPEWKRFIASGPGIAGAFPWISLWIDANKYVVRGDVAVVSYNTCAFIDDGREVTGALTMHGARGPGWDAPRMYFSSVMLLHFGFIPEIKNLAKQAWYKVWWRDRGGKSFHTNRNHNWHWKIRQDHLDAADPEWYRGFDERGVDLRAQIYPYLSWHQIDVLRRMAKNGSATYATSDIWQDCNWEELRQFAISSGVAGMPTEPLPRQSLLNRVRCELSRSGVFRRWVRAISRRVMRAFMG